MIENIAEYYLYRHIRLDKNEPFYVGIGTKNKRNSFKDSMLYSRAYDRVKRNEFWKRVVAKTEYEVEILLESDDYEFIKQKEIEFIALHGRRDLGKGTLANLTDGGDTAGKPINSKYSFEGTIHSTKQGGNIIILEYKNYTEVFIKFLEGGEKRWVAMHDIRRGILKNNFIVNTSNIGYVGGKIENHKAYSVWGSLMVRYKTKEDICKKWHNFKNFEKWFEENYNSEIMQDWILCSNILEVEILPCSTDNCYFLPKILSNQFKKSKGYFIRKDGKISAKFNRKHLGYFKTKEEAIEKYKEVKKQHIINLANNYRDILPEHVYNKILSYQIKIAP